MVTQDLLNVQVIRLKKLASEIGATHIRLIQTMAAYMKLMKLINAGVKDERLLPLYNNWLECMDKVENLNKTHPTQPTYYYLVG